MPRCSRCEVKVQRQGTMRMDGRAKCQHSAMASSRSARMLLDFDSKADDKVSERRVNLSEWPKGQSTDAIRWNGMASSGSAKRPSCLDLNLPRRLMSKSLRAEDQSGE
ncbi:hypothetical protein BDR07DRAFT_1403555 [Suillus spraguei]|nr:hypothetical protein BDR07DRAFT_1403555 [Suillus spraguei]